jgi:branched-chain amino acid transport system ATP-binding protein
VISTGGASVVLEVRDVGKQFGALAALTDVSFAVREGEVFSVIGPNGAGKSTLFNVISGLHTPSRGKVVFQGEDLTGLPPELINRKGLAKTFQITNVFPEISVYETSRAP